MSNNLEVKKQAVSEITKKFQDAKSVVIVNYKGLTVEQVTALRAQCRAAKVDYCVLKNTLARRALDDLKITGLLDRFFDGDGAHLHAGNRRFGAIFCQAQAAFDATSLGA